MNLICFEQIDVIKIISEYPVPSFGMVVRQRDGTVGGQSDHMVSGRFQLGSAERGMFSVRIGN